ncbi:hypothetical protein GOP47_0002180 [Adiantum capillus-veneris]|uniref:Uncharacterized protein n=1 Tax=Adiantum capillus-veneris TaxID=13818 RepID=A0A9D4VBK5_ADICA|nr:hypothetical protein GOP47_0002180 [Adiantum capillus-veneris]
MQVAATAPFDWRLLHCKSPCSPIWRSLLHTWLLLCCPTSLSRPLNPLSGPLFAALCNPPPSSRLGDPGMAGPSALCPRAAPPSPAFFATLAASLLLTAPLATDGFPLPSGGLHLFITVLCSLDLQAALHPCNWAPPSAKTDPPHAMILLL